MSTHSLTLGLTVSLSRPLLLTGLSPSQGRAIAKPLPIRPRIGALPASAPLPSTVLNGFHDGHRPGSATPSTEDSEEEQRYVPDSCLLRALSADCAVAQTWSDASAYANTVRALFLLLQLTCTDFMHPSTTQKATGQYDRVSSTMRTACKCMSISYCMASRMSVQADSLQGHAQACNDVTS